MAKVKKLNINVLNDGVARNLGDGIKIAKKGDIIEIGFPDYNNPNIKVVSVKRSAEGKSTFGSVAVNAEGFGTLNVQVFKNFENTTKTDDKGNVISVSEPRYAFRHNNQPILRNQQPGLAHVIDSDKLKIIKMLEFNPEISKIEDWITKNLANKDNGTYQDGDLDYILQDYKQSSRAYASILRQKNAGKTLTDAQQAVLDNVEEKSSAGISRLTVKYGKRTVASYDFDTKLGAITSDTSDSEATETIDMTEDEEI